MSESRTFMNIFKLVNKSIDLGEHLLTHILFISAKKKFTLKINIHQDYEKPEYDACTRDEILSGGINKNGFFFIKKY